MQIKALKYHGGQEISDIENENLEYLDKGIENLLRHVDNLKNKFGLNVVVAINRYVQDTEKEIKLLEKRLQEKGVELSLTEVWAKGGKGAEDLAKKVVKLCEENSNFTYMYEDSDDVIEKIRKVATKVYGAEDIEISDEAKKNLEEIKKAGIDVSNYPVCIAKTQYSFSDDPKNLLCEEPFKIHVREIIVKNGAEFLVVITGNIFTMPGLPKIPAAENIDLDENENIEIQKLKTKKKRKNK